MKLIKGIEFNVILLGITSFLTDVSSEIILPILPLFILALGGTGLIVGLIAGLGDSLASILKVFSGYWSDKLGKRKIFVSTGYLTSACSKILLAFSIAWQHILVLRPLERVGKGLRTVPRDALIAESEKRGKAFGIHRALDTFGAVTGSALAFIFLWVFLFDYRKIILLAAIPAFLALIPIIFVKERKRRMFSRPSIKLPRNFYFFVLVASVFACGNFTYMFFILKATASLKILGFESPVALAVLLYVFFNLVYASLATFTGELGDKIGRKKVLILGYLVFGITCFGFAMLTSLASLIFLFLLYGAFYALVEGNQRAFVADFVKPELRGAALGIFHTAIGILALPSSLLAGLLWSYVSITSPFVLGAVLAFISSLLFISVKSPKTK